MSAIEVEYKFRISHAQYTLLQERLQLFCTQCTEIHIYDEYFTFPHSSQYIDVRLRQSTCLSSHTAHTTTYYLTYKNKLQDPHQPRKGEVNEEYETKIEHYHVMKKLFLLLQGTLLVVKEKRGYVYTVPVTSSSIYEEFEDVLSSFRHYTITAELLEVTSLGYFLEIEIMLPEKSTSSQIHTMQKIVLAFAKQLDIADTQIEPKLYMDLLRER